MQASVQECEAPFLSTHLVVKASIEFPILATKGYTDAQTVEMHTSSQGKTPPLAACPPESFSLRFVSTISQPLDHAPHQSRPSAALAEQGAATTLLSTLCSDSWLWMFSSSFEDQLNSSPFNVTHFYKGFHAAHDQLIMVRTPTAQVQLSAARMRVVRKGSARLEALPLPTPRPRHRSTEYA